MRQTPRNRNFEGLKLLVTRTHRLFRVINDARHSFDGDLPNWIELPAAVPRVPLDRNGVVESTFLVFAESLRDTQPAVERLLREVSNQSESGAAEETREFDCWLRIAGPAKIEVYVGEILLCHLPQTDDTAAVIRAVDEFGYQGTVAAYAMLHGDSFSSVWLELWAPSI